MAITRIGGANAISGSITSSNLPTGTVLQVQSTAKLDVFSTTSTSFTDVTGLSVSITPSSTSNKIYIMASVPISNDTADRNCLLEVTRGDTQIYIADQSGSSRVRAGGGIHTTHGVSQTQENQYANIMFLDSPSSSSSLTYKIKALTKSGTMFIGRTGDSTDNDNRASFPSSITVMEIKG
jgi:hypothetical protein|tara:strand:- start:50 stop:589 length:540 start_codon:yes stop_codon:yes gene_type:complete